MTSKPYTGKVLWVDLSGGEIRTETLPDSFYEKYLSGMGLAAALLYREIPPQADPLGPENVLGFVAGLLTGTGALFAGRWLVVGKSPLTGTWGDSSCGGSFAPAIKQCGYDGIFVRGISPHPVVLYVTPGGAALEDASSLWGLDAVETEQALWREARGPKKPAVACIGEAGENRSLIAGICHDQGRLAARSGLGAVMGAKGLKAVVLNGARRIGCAHPAEMKTLSQRCNQYAHFSPPGLTSSGRVPHWIGIALRKLPFAVTLDGLLTVALYRKWGTSGMNRGSIEWGDAPVRNWAGSERDFDARKSQAVDPDRVIAREQRKYHCYSCPLGCGGICTLNAPGGTQPAAETHKPEYETIMAFSALLLNTDLEAIFAINDRLNRAGMDTISAGNVVAFALEAYEKGLLTAADTGGLELQWGDAGAIRALLELMIRRQGIGELLADGVKRAAKRLGERAAELTSEAGGQELAFHDPRLDPGYGLHSSVEPTPGRHTTGSQVYYDTFRLWKKVRHLPQPPLIFPKSRKYEADPEKAVRAVAVSNFTQLYNAAGLCLFGALMGVDRLPVFEWLNAATGWEKSPDEYMHIGWRIQTLRQMFNVRQGVDPRQLKLSPRALGFPPMKVGANRGRSVPLDALRPLYWAEIGWNRETGVPLPETIQALELEADELL